MNLQFEKHEQLMYGNRNNQITPRQTANKANYKNALCRNYGKGKICKRENIIRKEKRKSPNRGIWKDKIHKGNNEIVKHKDNIPK